MKITQVSDKELLHAYIHGDEASLEALITKHKRKVFTSIYLIVNDRFVAEDLFQETFIKVVQTLRSGRYKEEDKFIPWVMRIARNMAIDHFRKSRRNVMISGEDGEDILGRIEINEKNREEQLMLNQTQQTVRQLIALLPEEQRTVLILRQYAELSFKEIADITHVSINTALGRMRYALNNLRKMILEKELHLQ